VEVVVVAACRSCQAEVRFVPSAKTGKPMILDAKPEKRVVVVPPDVGQTAFGGQVGPFGPDVAVVVDTYVDHHVTCPAAAEWKGRRRG
jgi:hypothetical protein